MRFALLALLGFSFGALSAAGVFTVLAAVSLVPRFVGKTHTGKDVSLYENMIILGTIIGGFYSLYENRILAWRGKFEQGLAELIGNTFGAAAMHKGMYIWDYASTTVEFGLLVLGGVFSGMFVGCLALAIAEMLDSIPIFARRVRLQKGVGLVVFGIAVGKFLGSLLYFLMERTGW